MIDLDSFLLGIGALLAMTAFLFSFITTFRHNNRAGRLWSAALVTGATAVLYAGFSQGGDGIESAVATGLIAVSFILLWCGCRALARRSSPAWVALVVGLVVTVVTWLDPTPASLPDGLSLAVLVAGVSSLLTARELRRGAAALNLHARVLKVTLNVAAGAAVLWWAAAIAFVASGQPETAALVGTVHLGAATVLLVAVLCIAALRVELLGNWWSSDGHRPDLSWTFGVMVWRGFAAAARDQIDRASHFGGSVTILIVELQYLDEVNIAYGRAAGDESLLELGQILRAHVPSAALIGHLGAGRFAVLIDSSVRSGPEAVAGAIARGLEETWARTTSRQRISALYGTATTEAVRPDGIAVSLERLIASASEEMEPFSI